MKKLTLTLLLLLSAATASAQDIFNLVRDGAARTVNNPTSGIAATMVAQFKLTTLNYISGKCQDLDAAQRDTLLDTQAYFLSEFIDLYIEQILQKMPKDEKRKLVMMFMDASKSNPLLHRQRRPTHALLPRHRLGTRPGRRTLLPRPTAEERIERHIYI